MVVHLMQAHHVDVGAHHGIVIRILQLPQVALILAAVGKAGQGVVAVGEIQLLAELVGLGVLSHPYRGPGVLGAAAPAGQHFQGDPEIALPHLEAEPVILRLLGVEQQVLQGPQIRLLLEQLHVIGVQQPSVHQSAAEGGKILLLGRVGVLQEVVPFDDLVAAGVQVQQRKLQHIVGDDLVSLQGHSSLFRVPASGHGPAVLAQQVPAHIPVAGVAGLGQQLLGIFHRHGLKEVITLAVHTVGGLQHRHLLRGLHPLGNDG